MLLLVCTLSVLVMPSNAWGQVLMSTSATETPNHPPTKAQRDAAAKKARYEKMLRWDKKYHTLSKKQKKQFIKYWISYYTKKLKVKKSRQVSGRKACAIATMETSLGTAGVGKSKNCIFALKQNAKGKYVGGYPHFKNHRIACKALVVYYKQGKEWRLWKKYGR